MNIIGSNPPRIRTETQSPDLSQRRRESPDSDSSEFGLRGRTGQPAQRRRKKKEKKKFLDKKESRKHRQAYRNAQIICRGSQHDSTQTKKEIKRVSSWENEQMEEHRRLNGKRPVVALLDSRKSRGLDVSLSILQPNLLRGERLQPT